MLSEWRKWYDISTEDIIKECTRRKISTVIPAPIPGSKLPRRTDDDSRTRNHLIQLINELDKKERGVDAYDMSDGEVDDPQDLPDEIDATAAAAANVTKPNAFSLLRQASAVPANTRVGKGLSSKSHRKEQGKEAKSSWSKRKTSASSSSFRAPKVNPLDIPSLGLGHMDETVDINEAEGDENEVDDTLVSILHTFSQTVYTIYTNHFYIFIFTFHYCY